MAIPLASTCKVSWLKLSRGSVTGEGGVVLAHERSRPDFEQALLFVVAVVGIEFAVSGAWIPGP